MIRKFPFTTLLVLATFTVCMVPIPETPLSGVAFIDKWTHAALYFGLEAVYWAERGGFGRGSDYGRSDRTDAGNAYRVPLGRLDGFCRRCHWSAGRRRAGARGYCTAFCTVGKVTRGLRCSVPLHPLQKREGIRRPKPALCPPDLKQCEKSCVSAASPSAVRQLPLCAAWPRWHRRGCRRP